MQTFVNFVLLGKTGKCLEGETYVEEAYEALEDCVILVQPFGMSIFYRSVSHSEGRWVGGYWWL